MCCAGGIVPVDWGADVYEIEAELGIGRACGYCYGILCESGVVWTYYHCPNCYAYFGYDFCAPPFMDLVRCTECGPRLVRQGPFNPIEPWECQVNYGEDVISEHHIGNAVGVGVD